MPAFPPPPRPLPPRDEDNLFPRTLLEEMAEACVATETDPAIVHVPHGPDNPISRILTRISSLGDRKLPKGMIG